MTRQENRPSRSPLVVGRAVATMDLLSGLGESRQGDALDLPALGAGNRPEPVMVRDGSDTATLPVGDALRGLVGGADVLRESGDARPKVNKAVRHHSQKVQLVPRGVNPMSDKKAHTSTDDLYPPHEYDGGMIDKRAEREERAGRLRQARIAAGFKTMAEAIRACGWALETYKAHENGRNGFDTAQARQYARRYKVSTAWLMTGSDEAEPVETAVQVAPVVGEVAAGRWLAVDYHDEAQWAPVPFVPGRYAELPQTAYRVVGPSMDRMRIEDGDFIITVPYAEARSAPQSGDIVVVEIHHAGMVERTCKELIVTRQNYELWPRSSHPAYKDPIIVPQNSLSQNGPFRHDDDGKTITLTALVIGRFRPFGLNY